MKPPAAMIRSNDAAVDHQVLDDGEGGGPPGLDGQRRRRRWKLRMWSWQEVVALAWAVRARR